MRWLPLLVASAVVWFVPEAWMPSGPLAPVVSLLTALPGLMVVTVAVNRTLAWAERRWQHPALWRFGAVIAGGLGTVALLAAMGGGISMRGHRGAVLALWIVFMLAWSGAFRALAFALDWLTSRTGSVTNRVMAVVAVSAGVTFALGKVVRIEAGEEGSALVPLLALVVIGGSVLGTAKLLMEPLSRSARTLAERLRAVGNGELGPELPVTGRDELAQMATAFNQMLRGLRERDLLERAFGRYVTLDIWEALKARGALDVATERRDATVLYADIRGFTQLSEALDAAEVMRVLNLYFERMLEVIAAHGGYVNKFIGDAVMVIFNAPVDQPDHALRAVRCAEQMQQAVEALNAAGALGRPLAIGIGVNSGPLVAGNLGGQQRAEYTVIGDTVNVAARLTSAAQPGEVLVGAVTAARVAGAIALEPIAPLKVKGKTDPLEVCRLAPALRRPA